MPIRRYRRHRLVSPSAAHFLFVVRTSGVDADAAVPVPDPVSPRPPLLTLPLAGALPSSEAEGRASASPMPCTMVLRVTKSHMLAVAAAAEGSADLMLDSAARQAGDAVGMDFRARDCCPRLRRWCARGHRCRSCQWWEREVPPWRPLSRGSPPRSSSRSSSRRARSRFLPATSSSGWAEEPGPWHPPPTAPAPVLA